MHKWCHRIFIYYPIKNNGYSDYYVSKYMYIAVLWNVYIIQGSDVPKLPCVAMETVSMHIDTVVLYVYQYCRSIDTGNVITIYSYQNCWHCHTSHHQLSFVLLKDKSVNWWSCDIKLCAFSFNFACIFPELLKSEFLEKILLERFKIY